MTAAFFTTHRFASMTFCTVPRVSPKYSCILGYFTAFRKLCREAQLSCCSASKAAKYDHHRPGATESTNRQNTLARAIINVAMDCATRPEKQKPLSWGVKKGTTNTDEKKTPFLPGALVRRSPQQPGWIATCSIVAGAIFVWQGAAERYSSRVIVSGQMTEDHYGNNNMYSSINSSSSTVDYS